MGPTQRVIVMQHIADRSKFVILSDDGDSLAGKGVTVAAGQYITFEFPEQYQVEINIKDLSEDAGVSVQPEQWPADTDRREPDEQTKREHSIWLDGYLEGTKDRDGVMEAMRQQMTDLRKVLGV